MLIWKRSVNHYRLRLHLNDKTFAVCVVLHLPPERPQPHQHLQPQPAPLRSERSLSAVVVIMSSVCLVKVIIFKIYIKSNRIFPHSICYRRWCAKPTHGFWFPKNEGFTGKHSACWSNITVCDIISLISGSLFTVYSPAAHIRAALSYC